MDENNMDEKTIIVIDDKGNEQSMDILFTFEDDTYNKNYVLYIDPNDETGEVFVSSFTEDGQLLNIEDPKEWEMIEEVFSAFVIQDEGEEHDHDHDHDHDHHGHEHNH